MPKSDFVSHNDTAFLNQLKAFSVTLPTYASLLDVDAAEVTACQADADYFAYLLTCNEVARNCASQNTSWKNSVREGGTTSNGAPAAPLFPSAVTPVVPGIEPRFRALAKRLKLHPRYDVSFGKALGIEGAESAAKDLSTVQPDLNVTISGDEVKLGWGWGGLGDLLDICEIQVRRGVGQPEELLTYDTTPGYTDIHPFPSTPQRWEYRAIYRVGDSRVGQWSATVSIVVGG